ncbi:MAG: cold shock domain-containing protein [Candidatus Omnitrophica bacterium]|nr:cold shock domain-containing protein [Candidatus Omnitrophota bacterium]
MPKGKVAEYDPARGYGIIIGFDSGQRLTVYANYVKLPKGENLKIGQDVEYDVESNRHTNLAVNVKICSD